MYMETYQFDCILFSSSIVDDKIDKDDKGSDAKDQDLCGSLLQHTMKSVVHWKHCQRDKQHIWQLVYNYNFFVTLLVSRGAAINS